MSLDLPLKKMMVESLMKVWEEMADVVDPDKPESTILRYPKELQERFFAGEDTDAIIADLMTMKVQELEAAYPTKLEELRTATNDVRAIMQRAKQDIVEQRADWRQATAARKAEMGL